MQTNGIKSINFKGYIPVRYYSKEQSDAPVKRISSKEGVKKCQGYIVRNLNGTIKEQNKGFVDFFASYDKDYKLNPIVRSFYGKNDTDVFLITGNDVEKINEMAKPIGVAKSDAYFKTGSTRSVETKNASRSFFFNAKSYLKNQVKRIKDKNGKKLVLNVLFEPVYNKKGELKKVKYLDANFTPEK